MVYVHAFGLVVGVFWGLGLVSARLQGGVLPVGVGGVGSGGDEDPESEEVETGPSVHLPFDQFDPVDVSFDLT